MPRAIRPVETSARTSRPWHALPAEAALATLAARDEGLDPAEVEARMAAYGPNLLRPVRGPGIATLIARQLRMFLWEYSTEVDRQGPAIALREARTMTVTTVVFFQILYLFNCRSLRASMRTLGLFSNPAIFAGIALLLLLQAGFTYLPFMQEVFGTAGLTPGAIARSLLIAMVILPAIAIEKALRARSERRRATTRRTPPAALLAPRKAASP